MKNKIKSIFTGKNIVVIWVIATIFINLYTYLPDTTLRVEESYTACEILAENEKGETQVELPDGTIKWLELKNETTIEDGKYVMLELERSFNLLNQPRKFQIINTTYIVVGDANSVVDVLRYLVAPILVLFIYTVLSFCFFGYVLTRNKKKEIILDEFQSTYPDFPPFIPEQNLILIEQKTSDIIKAYDEKER